MNTKYEHLRRATIADRGLENRTMNGMVFPNPIDNRKRMASTLALMETKREMLNLLKDM